jgi:hypothetical protein
MRLNDGETIVDTENLRNIVFRYLMQVVYSTTQLQDLSKTQKLDLPAY